MPTHGKLCACGLYPEIVPNAMTIAAMSEPDDLRISYATVEELMTALHAEDTETDG